MIFSVALFFCCFLNNVDFRFGCKQFFFFFLKKKEKLGHALDLAMNINWNKSEFDFNLIFIFGENIIGFSF